MFHKKRVVATVVYLGALLATLIVAFAVRSIACCIVPPLPFRADEAPVWVLQTGNIPLTLFFLVVEFAAFMWSVSCLVLRSCVHGRVHNMGADVCLLGFCRYCLSYIPFGRKMAVSCAKGCCSS